MVRSVLLSLAVLLCSPGARAATPYEGYWRTPPAASGAASDLPNVLMHIRKGGEIFVVDLVQRNMGTYRAQEFPATLRDGILRVASTEGEVGLGFDAERGVVVGAMCRQPCVRIDAATFASLKEAAIKYRPEIPKIDFGSKK